MTIETPSDNAILESFSDDEERAGFNAFLSNLNGETPKEGAGEGKPAEGEETPAEGEEGTEETPEGSEGEGEGNEGEETPKPAEDDAEIDLKIGDQSRKVKLSEVRRLVEAEATLSAKTAETAKLAETAQAENVRAQTALAKMLERAKERFKPYEGLNLFLVSKQLDDASFTQLTKDMQAAHADVTFFEQELNALIQTGQKTQVEATQRAAQEAMRVLNTPNDPRHIPNFSRDTYNEMIDFASGVGLDRAAVLGLTDPAAIKLIHMAMQYAKGSKAVEQKTIKPVVHKPTKTIRPGSAAAQPSRTTSRTEAIRELRRTGSEEAGVKAFLATF